MTLSSANKKLKGEGLSSITRSDFESLRTILEIKQRMGFTVVTGSMEPLIKAGSKIEVEAIKNSPKKFDIIVFLSGDRLICHYLLHVNTLPSMSGHKTYVTRGLANSNEDFPCEEELIFGRVVSHNIPFWTRVRLSFKSFLNERN